MRKLRFKPEAPAPAPLPKRDAKLQQEERGPAKIGILGLAALGVVYGDIGTSPLYALRECFLGSNPVPPTSHNVLGVLSLIFWSLTLVISIKYMLYVMRQDNRGEGGILVLMSLIKGRNGRGFHRLLVVLGIFGAALLYGDGMITPAISVLSAIEGLNVATPMFTPYIIPITIAVLIVLFAVQHRGTGSVGAVFGPIMLAWFVVIAVLGVRAVLREPGVLAAINPFHGVRFFLENGWAGFLTLGSVFLVVTGGEALYADMGHFGRRPIQVAWFTVAFPALLLNYFGQGALLLTGTGEDKQPFYNLAPSWALYPLVGLATVATVIASQAVIAGAFSLTRQAVLLGDLPPMHIVQTSEEEIGQIYIPGINWILMLATIGLVVGFGSSSSLAGAYGVAVTTTMVITTILAYVVVRHKRKKMSPWLLGGLTALFLCIDLGFFGANILKIVQGGWFPLTIGLLVFTMMATWRRGREILIKRFSGDRRPLSSFLTELDKHPPVRVKGAAVFLTRHRESTPPILVEHLKHNQALHETVVLLTIWPEPFPRVTGEESLEVEDLRLGFHHVIFHYGYMQTPNVPDILRRCKDHGLDVDPYGVTYYVRRQTFIPTKRRRGMALWREHLFAAMARNALPSTLFFRIPPENVVEIGIEIEI